MSPLSEAEFREKLCALWDAHKLREFALYGLYAQEVGADGQLHPPDQRVWVGGEPMVAAEAEYRFGRVAEGKALVSSRFGTF